MNWRFVATVLSKSPSTTSPNSVCSLPVSLSHWGNSYNMSNFLIVVIFVLLTCHQWSSMLLGNCYVLCNCLGAIMNASIEDSELNPWVLCVFWLLLAVPISLYFLRLSPKTQQYWIRPINNTAVVSKSSGGRKNQTLLRSYFKKLPQSLQTSATPTPVSSQWHWGTTLHQQKDYNSLKAQMMVSIFFSNKVFLN